MKIDIDAVVKEYAVRTIASLFLGPERSFEPIGENDDEAQEIALVNILQGMVASGAAIHEHEAEKNVHKFSCTKRLIRHWGWVFPGDVLTISRKERYKIEISGDRSRLFEGNWSVEDRDNPLPAWPD